MLFWTFIEWHRDFFASNPRLSLLVRQLQRVGAQTSSALGLRAQAFLDELG